MSPFAGQEGKTPIWRTDWRVGTRARRRGGVAGGVERPGGPSVEGMPGGTAAEALSWEPAQDRRTAGPQAAPPPPSSSRSP